VPPLPPVGGAYAPGPEAQNAWPQTSPFTQHRMEATYNDGSLWNYESDDQFDCKRIFSLEYLYGHGAKTGNHFIGDPNFANLPVIPDDIGLTTFHPQNTGLFGPLFHNGMRVRYGYENPDDSGMILSGFILFENTESNRQFQINQVLGNLQTLASIIVSDGAGGGIALPYDTAFFQSFTQEILGADWDYYFMPFFVRPAFKVKMVMGAKYLRISEQFLVRASDSGQGYGVDLPTGTAGPIFEGPFTQLTQPYTTVINSSVTNNLVGPVLGLRYDLGGNKFKLWGQSKFGVMADIEGRSVSSANLNQFKIVLPTTTDPNFIAGPAAGSPTTPSRVTLNNTHMAALFDQQFNLELPLFEMIPWVNHLYLFKHANFRVGWQYVVVSEVARAANQIKYIIDQPGIDSHRTWFSYNAVNFSVDWKW
jgi:hypothetical protein